jgi:hypothetical protein
MIKRSIRTVGALSVWNELVRPIAFDANQSGAHRVLTNVSELLGQTLVMPKAVIEKIPLPCHACRFCRDSFVIANELAKRRLSINADQGVQMIGHEQQQLQIPSFPLVVNVRCVD